MNKTAQKSLNSRSCKNFMGSKQFYKIGEISISKTGEFRILYVGEVPEQGGRGFGWREYIAKDLGTLLNIFKKKIVWEHIEQLLKRK